jgi:hypothetical protein
MAVQYLTNKKGKKTAIQIPIREWRKIQKQISSERFLENFRESVIEAKQQIEGDVPLKNIQDLIDEL